MDPYGEHMTAGAALICRLRLRFPFTCEQNLEAPSGGPELLH